MLIVKFMGGLGNQMFQYALYKRMTLLGKDVAADLSSYNNKSVMPFCLTQAFPDISIRIDQTQQARVYEELNANRNIFLRCLHKILPSRKYVYAEREEGQFDKNVLKMDSSLLIGYWQTDKYWFDNKKQILEDFQFHLGDLENEYRDKLRRYKSVASLHIRGGDYLKAENQKLFGGICSQEYYLNAIRYIQEIDPDCHFLVFTNDLEYSKSVLKNIGVQYSFAKDIVCSKDDWHDLYLMSQCNYNIIANSSFSWWGAFLNVHDRSSVVVAPKRWLNDREMKDICPENWIRM